MYIVPNVIKRTVFITVVYFYYNINGRDVQRKNAVNYVDKSSLWAPWQNGPYKNTQNITNTEYTKTQHTLRNNYFLCFSDFSVFFLIFNFQLLKGLLQKCWITALVRSMKNIGGLNQFVYNILCLNISSIYICIRRVALCTII